MKKIIALALALALTLSLAACGAPSNNNGGGSSNKGSSKGAPSSFEEIVAVDNDECAITITGIDEDDFWGYALKVTLENKSADTTYMFSVTNASINGVECDPFFATDVAAGKIANDDITFSDSALEDNDIGDYTDIELTFKVYDSENWDADPVALETVHVYPYGEDEATVYEREAQSSDKVILDNDYATVIVTGCDEDDFWGYEVNLFVINKSDANITVSADEVSVNGYMTDPLYVSSVSAGKCAFSSMTWSDSDFEDNGITDVEEIEFKLRVYDSDDWGADDYANEVITLNP